MDASSADWTAETIRQLRERLALSQQRFAEALGTTRQTIIHWESGAQTPKRMACRLLSLLEEQVDRGQWQEATALAETSSMDPRLTQLVLQTEDPEATARALLRIARMHRTTSSQKRARTSHG